MELIIYFILVFILGFLAALTIRNRELNTLRKLKITTQNPRNSSPNEVTIYSTRVFCEYRLWASDELNKIPELEYDIIYIIIALFRSSVPPKSIIIKAR